MIETQDREAELKRQSTKQKKMLLDNLAEEENKMEAEMLKFQKLRDEERKLLNDKMNQAEQQSDFLIKELMVSNMRYSDPTKVMEALEADKKQMEAQLTIVNGDAEKLKEKEVLRKFLIPIFKSKKLQSLWEVCARIVKHYIFLLMKSIILMTWPTRDWIVKSPIDVLIYLFLQNAKYCHAEEM